MVLVSSNPTNLVLSSASGINFIYFSAWTIIPAILSATSLYFCLVLQYFHKKQPDLVPRRLEMPEVYPRAELKDVSGAILKAVLLAVTLLALIISSVLVKGLYVWWVTVPAALTALMRDVVHDIKHRSSAAAEELELQEDEPLPQLETVKQSRAPGQHVRSTMREPERRGNADNAGERRWTLPTLLATVSRTLPTVYSVTLRMPWALLPFAFSFFILVESLSTSGWIGVWASWASVVVKNNDVVAIFFFGFLCIFLCNVGPSQRRRQSCA